MELRVLKYFLAAAQEGSVTRAAQLLHITQPTLSRQLMQLEDELGVKLFSRGGRRLALTEDGMLLRRRAREIIGLADRTEREFTGRRAELSGEVAIGSAETNSMGLLSERIAAFRRGHPAVSFSIYSATADDIKERLEKGLLDLGLLSEPVGTEGYEYIRLPREDVWGALVREDSPLAALESVGPAELAGVPLIIGRRREVKDELLAWLGEYGATAEIAATYNLILNAANMVLHGVGAALCFGLAGIPRELRFIPLRPELRTGTVLVWKKGEACSLAAGAFIRELRDAFRA